MGREGVTASGGPVTVGWDTCTLEGTIAVGRGRRVLSEKRFRTVKGHTSWLMPLVDEVMRGLGLTPRDIEAIAVGVGPGNFTGVKVGVATAKAMAFALEVPLVGVPTLDTIAQQGKGESEPLLPVIDARRGLFYTALYDASAGVPERVTSYECLSPEGVASLIPAGAGKVALAGDTLNEVTGALLEKGVHPFEVGRGMPMGADLLAVAARALSSGAAGTASSVEPIYLKKPV